MNVLACGLFLALSYTLVSPAYSCSCVTPFPSRRDSITSGFCWPRVYVGTVIGVTCNCIPEGSGQPTYCQDYQLQQGNVVNAEVATRGECNGDYPLNDPSRYFRNCTALGPSILSSDLTIEGPSDSNLPPFSNITRSSGECGLSCPFNEEGYDGTDDDEINWTEFEYKMQPCFYRVRVDEVFRGNISEGDELTVSGPDVLTSCGNRGRYLQINQRYVAGIGSGCVPISDWSTYESYSSGEIEQLRGLRGQLEAGTIDCGTLELLPSLILTVITLLLTVA